MTDLLDTFVAVLLVGVLDLVLLAWIRSRHPGTEGRFLVGVCVATLLLRAGIALALNAFATNSAFAGAFWGDSGTYDAGGHALARHWSGESGGTYLTEALSGYGFVYCVGAIYFVFGRNQLLVQLLNCTAGVMTVLVVHAIAARLFGRNVARWSALFMAFFPQMVFWSAGMYKDPAILLCIATCMYAVLRLRVAFSAGQIVLFLGAAFALFALRFYVFYFVVAAALATFLFSGRGRPVQRVASLAILVGALAGGLTLGTRQETLEAQKSYMTLDQVQVTRADQAMWGQSAYGAEYDVTTPGGALRALPAGLLYLIFAPFPWAISGLRQMLALPETLVWYALMPSFVRGLVHAIRHRLRDILPILVFTVTLTMAYALMQGNVGTAYRQRTQITMFFFVFMALGIVEGRRGAILPVEAPAAGPGTAQATATRRAATALKDRGFLHTDESGLYVPGHRNSRTP